jgi:prophage antirepressor-like protein
MAAQSPVVSFNFVAQSVRIVMRDDDPWFVAVDVCAALTLANPSQALSKLDDDECQVVDFSTLHNVEGVVNQQVNPGQKINIINESGLYSLILTSRKPEAKKFKKWVTSEVLPAIRKTGRYVAPHVAPHVAPVAYISGAEESELSHRIWQLARPFYMEGSIKHWLYQYVNALAGVHRRQFIPARQFPEVLAMLNSLEAQVAVYRTERIRHEKEWLLLTLKRELDKRLGRTGPEFEMLTAPSADLTA